MAAGLLLPLVPAGWACLLMHGFRDPGAVPRTALNLTAALIAALLGAAAWTGTAVTTAPQGPFLLVLWLTALAALLLGHAAGLLRRRD